MANPTDCKRCGAHEWYRLDVDQHSTPAVRRAAAAGLCGACPEYVNGQATEQPAKQGHFPPWLEYDPTRNKLTRRNA